MPLASPSLAPPTSAVPLLRRRAVDVTRDMVADGRADVTMARMQWIRFPVVTRVLLVSALALLSVDRRAGAADVADLTSVLQEYAADPWRRSADLLDAVRAFPGELPPPVVLAVGDAELRRGRFASARRRFEGVLQSGVGEPWATFADLSLGWLGLRTGDDRLTRESMGRVLRGSPQNVALAHVVLGLQCGAVSDLPCARSNLDAVAADGSLPREVRDTALLSLGYSQYWAHEVSQAITTLTALAERDATACLADDGRYALGRVLWAAGEEDRASELLWRLAEHASPAARRGRPPTLARLDLESRAILRDAFERYRRAPLVAGVTLGWLLDADGALLAREFLARHAERTPDLAPEDTGRVEAPNGAMQIEGSAQPADTRANQTPTSAQTTPTPSVRRSPILEIVVLALVVAAVAIWRRRART